MDEHEFDDKIKAVTPALYKTAYMCLGSEELATQAVDKAVFLALTSLGSLRDPESFEQWVTCILIDVCRRSLDRSCGSLNTADPVPEAAPLRLDFTAERARAKRAQIEKNARAKKAFFVPFGTLAAVFVIFAALVNFYAPFAQFCHTIPTLSELSDAVTLDEEYIQQNILPKD